MSLSWIGIARLGLVQIALGAIVSLTTSTMNRVMTVELAFPAVLPGLLVALYYGTQFLRPHFGHSADQGGRRVPWIIGGVLMLAAGAIFAALSVGLMGSQPVLGIIAAVPSFLMIGLGIGAGGTNLLALLASRVDPSREAAAGSAIWIMMIFGLVVTAIVTGKLLDPYSATRLVAVTAGVSAIAIALTLVGIWGQERGAMRRPPKRALPFRAMLAEIWAEPRTRAFAIFVFASMTAYNLQDLILEPFAGHVFGMTVGQSTELSGRQHAGALTGMLAVLLAGTVLTRFFVVPLRVWIVGGCLVSGVSLMALGYGAQFAPDWPIRANVFALGLANGVFAVAAIGAMMGIARDGTEAREGARMGLFGAAQAIGFGIGSFGGTVAADVMRAVMATDAAAYGSVFAVEGLVFVVAAALALRVTSPDRAMRQSSNMVPGE
ncbi:MAG: BCD family MFS transporter [Pseudomonadota bacterium]